MMQYVAVCCSVLQYVAACCSVLQCVEKQCVAVCCSMLPVCCIVLHFHTSTHGVHHDFTCSKFEFVAPI